MNYYLARPYHSIISVFFILYLMLEPDDGGRWVLITVGDHAGFLVVEEVKTQGADEGTPVCAPEGASLTDAETWSTIRPRLCRPI